jgi:SAM-dependent methyltransferase
MVHSSAADGYDTSAVSSYVSARPSYHPDAVARLAALLDGCERVIDLGAGTGILTAALADAGVPVTGVEPLEAMREQFAQQHPSLDCVDGTAERIPFADGSVDAVVVGQAFHWFDHGPALDELARVLRPGGVLALVWNVRDQAVDWVREWTNVVADPTGTTPRHHKMLWRYAIDTDLRWTPFDDWSIANPWPTTRQGVVDRALSVSYVGAMADPERAAIAQAIAELVDDFEEPFDYPYNTELNVVRHQPGAFPGAGIALGERLHGGHQSVVHRANRGGEDIVVKSELRPDPWLEQRMDVVAAAAEANPEVVPPLRTEGELVVGVGGRRCVLHPFIKGTPADLGSPDTAESMGRVLARLHDTLRSIDGAGLPDVAALRACKRPGDPEPAGRRQLIHGYFATSNLIETGQGLRVIDFGELGVGTCAFDIANTLFMERFSATLAGRGEGFDRFAAVFVAAYVDESGVHIPDDVIEAGVAIRRMALGRWLQDLEHAPAGIARSSGSWRNTLRRFAETHHHDWVNLV